MTLVLRFQTKDKIGCFRKMRKPIWERIYRCSSIFNGNLGYRQMIVCVDQETLQFNVVGGTFNRPVIATQVQITFFDGVCKPQCYIVGSELVVIAWAGLQKP